MNKTTHCLEVKNLGFSYGQKKVLNNMNFIMERKVIVQAKVDGLLFELVEWHLQNM